MRLDLTKNLAYDRLTRKILRQELKSDSNCIDIGCHKGEILNLMLGFSPHGIHFGFEPLPSLFDDLSVKYKNTAKIYNLALSDKTGTSNFQFVKNAPAYSGFRKRKYDISNPEIEEIEVETAKLDDVISLDQKIDLIKIDVEGAELLVLKGAKQLLLKNKPFIIFECGLGANDFYESSPSDLFNFISIELGLQISLLKSFLDGSKPLTLFEFEKYFDTNEEYYFITHKRLI